MGLKRFVSSILRNAQQRSSKAGQLVSGCPSVFNEDGMWNSSARRQATKDPGKPQEHGLEQRSGYNAAGLESPPPYRLPRKRCWLSKRKDWELQAKK